MLGLNWPFLPLRRLFLGPRALLLHASFSRYARSGRRLTSNSSFWPRKRVQRRQTDSVIPSGDRCLPARSPGRRNPNSACADAGVLRSQPSLMIPFTHKINQSLVLSIPQIILYLLHQDVLQYIFDNNHYIHKQLVSYLIQDQYIQIFHYQHF